MKNNTNNFFPAEWHPQGFVQLTWPHQRTDWAYMLSEVQTCFVNIAKEIAKRQKLLIVTPEPENVMQQISGLVNMDNVRFAQIDTNDTWARDHGGLTVIEDGSPIVLDFCFNGWGLKFASDKDNLITQKLIENDIINANIRNCRNFVFEGGSIESDGQGTLLTTSECLLSPNRNATMSRDDIERYLCKTLHSERVLWLNHGYLKGDDTDSHIDTLARLCPNDQIVYVKCEDSSDEHFRALTAMEEEIKAFCTKNGMPYKLIPLPMTSPIYDNENERLPATYANFLIINGAVLVPVYNDDNDELALMQIQSAFPNYEIIGINCLPLIKQHGSLHCVTMQYPKEIKLI